jgi:lipopolysaccharide/colanic/teichoic acid biosynthesis glycosyltransferase
MKRCFDVAASLTALIVLAPLFALLAPLIMLDSRGPVLFRQWRVGRHYRPFLIYKFRTMRVDDMSCRTITPPDDPRVTRLGRVLRATKLDELPQLINVLRGDMSLVGPRPEILHYVELFHRAYGEVLQVRPGLTDLASIKYRDEAAALAAAPDPEQEYVTRILPDKIELARQYVRHSSLLLDLRLIALTINRIVFPRIRLQ